MTTYCAPCLADLALLREAVTAVSGTAACVAHAVLLTHPGDTPQRRLERLSDLRSMAEGKLTTASPQDVPAIEELVQEYALAGAMDMTVPLKDLAGDRTPRPPKARRARGRDRQPGDRQPGDRQQGDRQPRPPRNQGDPAGAENSGPSAPPAGEQAPSPVPTEPVSVPVAAEPVSAPAPVEPVSAPAPVEPVSAPATDSAPDSQ